MQRKKRAVKPRTKTEKKQEKSRIQEQDLGLNLRRKLQDQLGNQSFLFFSCFFVYFLIMGMYLMVEPLLFIFLLQTMN